MLRKGYKVLLAEANAAIDRVDAAEALRLHGRPDVVFVDVRELHEWQNGYIPGACHAPRGFLEFIADPEAGSHQPALASGKRLIVYCGSGARSALAAKTLKDMGIANVANLVGGFSGWLQAGGAVERPPG
jgi:rhodanese-related sulfurtransferase